MLPNIGLALLSTPIYVHLNVGMQGVGCKGGNQNVERDLLTFGELILNDSLGFPYYRLINIG